MTAPTMEASELAFVEGICLLCQKEIYYSDGTWKHCKIDFSHIPVTGASLQEIMNQEIRFPSGFGNSTEQVKEIIKKANYIEQKKKHRFEIFIFCTLVFVLWLRYFLRQRRPEAARAAKSPRTAENTLQSAKTAENSESQ